jgi:hypothetical protein
MFFASCGSYMVCFFDGDRVPAVCGFNASARWASRAPADFPGTTPIKAMQGFAGPSVIVLDGSNVIWHCGLPYGDWVQDIPQPPVTFSQFMGAGLDSSGNWYVAAFDTQRRGWLIGSPTQGGQWAQVDGISPPEN